MINLTTKTAAKNLLRVVEDPFLSGTVTQWVGSISYYADTPDAAAELAQVLQVGLMWLPNVGAEKAVGFGRLRAVRIEKPTPRPMPATMSNISADTSFHLRISASEPIHIGGVKSRRTNYARSQRQMSGGLIKGALAEALNRAHGVRPVHRKLSAKFAHDYPSFALLAEYFHAIRITIALPTYAGEPRPVTIPISTVEVDGEMCDTALLRDDFPIGPHQAPVYFIDWKHGMRHFGAVEPKEIFVTRGEIDDVSQRSREGQLFSYSFLCPEDDHGRAIEWVCNVDFPVLPDEAQGRLLRDQFQEAVSLHLHDLGKLRRAVKVTVRAGRAPMAKPMHTLLRDGLAVVMLQSNAIMLDPAAVRELPPFTDLCDLYADYWYTLSAGALELEDFFAHQSFEGGYLYHRFLGAAEREANPDNYRPYYLTQAGSVFRLRAVDESRAHGVLSTWLATGLPLPDWALAEYRRPCRAVWETCPFVPENGYGEIIVNLAWHWDAQLPPHN